MTSASRPIFSSLTITLLALLSILGCSESTPSASSSDARTPYQITTTTGMITDIVKRVAGEHAQVQGLMNSGVDPHLYQPTRDDIQRLAQSDVVFYNGLHLEGKMTNTFERLAETSTVVVAVTEDLDGSILRSPPGFDGHHDPHVWMDPIAWCSAVEVVSRTLGEYDPVHATEYQEHARVLIEEIHDLSARAELAIGTIPESKRVLITAHDAFGYFGQRYHFEVIGIQGISTESEAGVRDIERIVDLIVQREIGAVFVETTVSERNIRALIAGAQSKGQAIKIGGSLFSDAMGLEGTYEGTYIGMIDHNITRIVRALGGEAPELGFYDRLTPEQP